MSSQSHAALTIKSVPKSKTDPRPRVSLNGQSFDYQGLNQALSHAANAQEGQEHTIVVQPVPAEDMTSADYIAPKS